MAEKVDQQITVKVEPHPDYPEHYLRTHSLMYGGKRLAFIQNAVAHCCGVTFMGQMHPNYMKDADVIAKIIAFYRDQRNTGRNVGGSLFYIKNLNFYLSEETVWWDAELRKVAKMVHSFRNGHHTVEQWVITIWDDAVDEEVEEDFYDDEGEEE